MSNSSIKLSQACDPILILNLIKVYPTPLHAYFSHKPYLTDFFSLSTL